MELPSLTAATAPFRPRNICELLFRLLRQKRSHPANSSHFRYLLEVIHKFCCRSLSFNDELQPPARGEILFPSARTACHAEMQG